MLDIINSRVSLRSQKIIEKNRSSPSRPIFVVGKIFLMQNLETMFLLSGVGLPGSMVW